MENSGGEGFMMLEQFDWQPEPEASVYDTMTEVAEYYYEEMEIFAEEHDKEAYAAYYIHSIDTEQNYYAVGVFGNQIAAASCPAFGAVMLQALAQEVTENSEIKIEFKNKLLPANKGVVS